MTASIFPVRINEAHIESQINVLGILSCTSLMMEESEKKNKVNQNEFF